MNRTCVQILAALIVVVCWACVTRANSREIQFPFTGGDFLGDPNSLAFAPDGKLGFALLAGADNVQRKLFSFSVTNSNVVAVVDITSDLAGSGGAGFAPVVSISLDYQAGILFVHGTDTATNERVICFAFDRGGQLTRLWAADYAGPQILSSGTELTFSGDGSRAFIVYSHSEQGAVVNRLDLLDTLSGTVLATADLTSSQSLALAVLLDDSHSRVVALCDQAAFIFKPATDVLEIDSRIDFGARAPLSPVGLSSEGHFLVTYAGFQMIALNDGVNIYRVYDLDLLRATEFEFPAPLFPASNQMAFNAGTGTIADAPIAGLQQSGGGLQFTLKPRRSLEIYSLAADGVLTRTFDIRTPKPDGGIFSGPVLSRSGALVLVPTVTGKLLSFDTLTGELIGNQFIGGNTATVIQLVESQQLLSFTDGTNKLTLVDMNTGPTVDGVKVRGSNTTLVGTNFLAGARVQINGMDVEGATRSPDDPGHIITISRGKRDFPLGQSFSISVINRDGLASEPFILTR
jgi:hypothetical protein